MDLGIVRIFLLPVGESGSVIGNVAYQLWENFIINVRLRNS